MRQPVITNTFSSSLPRRLEFRGDEFCSLERHHWESVPSLRSFMQSLLFINSVCELAEPQVLDSLLSYLHSGFLVPVLGPSLHKTNQEEALCSIAYLDLFVRSITSESLLRLILKFIVVHEHEGVPILETLTQRLGKCTVGMKSDLYFKWRITICHLTFTSATYGWKT